MGSKLKTFFKFLEDAGDPRIKDYFLMQTPLQPIGILIFYVIFVLKVVGPMLMKKRKPYNLRKLLITYNFLQIIFNGIVFYNFAKLLPEFSLVCSPVVSSDDPLEMCKIGLHISYIFLKFFDLFDSIFFVLRKKYSQLTYLHIHHHIGILIAAWISGKYFPLGSAYFVGLANTFVHVVMYSYYLVTSWNSKSFKKDLWWKKYITQLQIVQHLFIFTICFISVVNPYCTYPKFWMALFSLNVGLIIYLFCKFYVTAYMTKKIE